MDGADTVIAAIVDIEQLRQFREMSLFGNSMKDLRTEIFRHMYDEPIHPKNLWAAAGAHGAGSGAAEA